MSGDTNGKSERIRRDAAANRRRIIDVAADAMQADPDVSMEAVATSSGLGRATVYRHFRSRAELVAAVQARAVEAADSNERDELQPPGELGRDAPSPLDVVDVLNKVPPHQLAEQVVAEAQRVSNGSTVALYMVDIDGSRLRRMAGSQEFPEELPASLAVGPELSREGVEVLRVELQEQMPASVLAPLYLRSRAIGVLVAISTPLEPLYDLARQAGAALELAGLYTDSLNMARRRQTTTAAAEVQQGLLPPRICRLAGARVVGNVLPSYESGGDWFDHVENADGAWVAIADATGSGPKAAAMGALTLGAYRAARRRGADLPEAAADMDTAVAALESDGTVSAHLMRWHGPTSSVAWVDCGGPPPLLIDEHGNCEVLGPEDSSEVGPVLGSGDAQDRPSRTVRVLTGQKLVLHSTGVTGRQAQDGATFGLEGVRAAIAEAADLSAVGLVRSISAAVVAATDAPLDEDVTVVVLEPI